MNNNFVNIGLPTDSGGFFELQKAHENFMNQPHYTQYELNLSQSGFLDSRNNKYNDTFKDELYYNLTHKLYTNLTDAQREILDLYLCSGYNQSYITNLKNFKSSRAVLFHLEAIQKKVIKLTSSMPQKMDSSSSYIISDSTTGRRLGESTLDWFNREILGEEDEL